MAWDLLIDRADLAHTELVDAAPIDPSDGQVVLKVDRVGMTANNVTYAVFGDAMKYSDFFPAGELDGVAYGRVPLWGFAVVERSTVAGVEEGTRYFGYLPTSSHLLVEPTGVGPKGFRDASAHRQHLPTPYNGLTTTTGDLAYDADLEDLQILYRDRRHVADLGHVRRHRRRRGGAAGRARALAAGALGRGRGRPP